MTNSGTGKNMLTYRHILDNACGCPASIVQEGFSNLQEIAKYKFELMPIFLGPHFLTLIFFVLVTRKFIFTTIFLNFLVLKILVLENQKQVVLKYTKMFVLKNISVKKFKKNCVKNISVKKSKTNCVKKYKNICVKNY